MAFSAGRESSEGASRKLYNGVASCFVLAVNPTKAEQEKIFNTTIDKDPIYISTDEKTGVKTVRVTFVIKPDESMYTSADGTPVNVPLNHTFFLRNEPNIGANSGKTQVVDEYGNFAWATNEELSTGAIPQYTNGPAGITKGYRRAYVGEKELTEFLMKYLNIPSCFKWNQGKIVGMADNLADCQARLENVAKYFTGDVSEVKNAIKLQPKNKVKIAIGVKTTDDGKQYQATFNKMALNNATRNYDKLDAEIKSNSSNPVDYTGDGNVSKITDFCEYVVTPTNFATPAVDNADPFGAAPINDPFFTA